MPILIHIKLSKRIRHTKLILIYGDEIQIVLPLVRRTVTGTEHRCDHLATTGNVLFTTLERGNLNMFTLWELTENYMWFVHFFVCLLYSVVIIYIIYNLHVIKWIAYIICHKTRIVFCYKWREIKIILMINQKWLHKRNVNMKEWVQRKKMQGNQLRHYCNTLGSHLSI